MSSETRGCSSFACLGSEGLGGTGRRDTIAGPEIHAMNAVHKLSLAVIAAGLVALLGGVRFRLWELTPGSEEYKRNDRRYWTLFKYLGFLFACPRRSLVCRDDRRLCVIRSMGPRDSC
jgi:hypothetical protein